MDDRADKELYQKLTEGGGCAVSLTAYVKRILEEYFSLDVKMADRQEFYSQIFPLSGRKCSHRG